MVVILRIMVMRTVPLTPVSETSAVGVGAAVVVAEAVVVSVV